MIEGRYIHADEAQKFIDEGWEVELLPAHYPYCLAHIKRQTPHRVNDEGLDFR